MRLGVSNKQLAILFEQGAIIAVETAGRSKLRVTAAVRHEVDLSHGIADPKAVGEKLAEALQEAQIHTRKVAVGLPADWVMSRMKPAPVLGKDALASMLRLTADRSFSTDPGDLVIDFGMPASAEKSVDQRTKQDDQAESQQQVLLLAMLRKRLEEITQVLTAAGLHANAVAPTTVAIALADGHRDEDLIVRINGNTVELARIRLGRLSLLKQVSCPADGNHDTWALRRAFVSETPEPEAVPTRAVVWGQGAAQQPLCDLLESLGLPVTKRNTLDGVSIDLVAAGDVAPAQLAAAGALLQISDDCSAIAVNFAASKLEPKREPKFGRTARIGAIAGVGVAAIVLAMLFFAYELQSEVELLRAEAKQKAPDVEAAELLLEKIAYANQWGDDRPSMLEAMRDLTLQFPENGDIWATEINLRDDLGCTITGKATQTRHIVELRDKFQASPLFDGVKLMYMRDVGRAEPAVTFSIVLQLTPKVIEEAADATSAAATVTSSNERKTGEAG